MSASLSPTEIDFLLIGAIAGFLCGLAIIGLAHLIDRGDDDENEGWPCDRCHKERPKQDRYSSALCDECWDDVAPEIQRRRRQ